MEWYNELYYITKEEIDMNKKEKCFVMMPFTTPDIYDDDGHFDKIYKQIFVPAIKKAGYEPYRVDENKICDSIIDKIFDAVSTAPMALCDLSSKNPNVLYELGLRQAYDLPVVLVQDDVTDRIFDVSGISTVTYNNHRLVENVDEAIKSICEAIEQNTKQGRTLAKIVKAKSASFESVKVSEDDNINFLLNAILDDVQEIKRKNFNDDVFIMDPLKTKYTFFVIQLKKDITEEIIASTIATAKRLFKIDDVEWRREGRKLKVFVYSHDRNNVKVIHEFLKRNLEQVEE